MAKIPSFGNLQLGGVNTTLPGVVSIAPDVHKLGDGLNAVADMMLQKKREDDQLQYQKALLDLDAFGNDELNNPESGYRNLKGENALNEAGNYNQRYTDKIAEIREGLKGNSFLDKFDLQTKDMQTSYTRQLMVHESQEQSALALKTMQASMDVAMVNAQNLYGDQTSLAMGFDNLLARMDQFSQEQGMPEEIRQAQKEQITQQYFSSALDGWIAHTELTKGSFASLAGRMKKSLAYNKLSEINKAKYMLKLDSMIKHQGNVNKDSLALDLTNAWAMQQRGIEAENIPLARFNAVYGSKGQREYDAYQDKQAMARNIGAMQNMPTSEIIKFTQEDISKGGNSTADLTADISHPNNFAERVYLQSIRAKAAVALLKQRGQDPIAAAYQAGEVEDLDFSPESLEKRATQAVRISQDYQTPMRVFSDAEAKKISEMVDNSGYAQQLNLLQVLEKASNGNDDAYNAMLNDIGMPNPAFAVAGSILNSPSGRTVDVNNHWFKANDKLDKQTIAGFILKGAEALKPTGRGDSSVKGVSLPGKWVEDFDSQAGAYFADDPESKLVLQSAVMNYYVGKSISMGNYVDTHTINSDLLKESINAVTGEKSQRYNVRMPWGMDEQTFTSNVESQYLQIVKANGWGETHPYLENRFQLIPATNKNGLPDGRYFFKVGNGFLADKDGQTVVIDVLRGVNSIKDIPE
ncbi:hypothetical protein [uncultured Gilliamella sp.]|uniref:hypothetical protein n=1 Tax=uncultured Gilliamella sp. TaxID=1193505 RepID=UPI0025E7DC82|nr:hypothetical protein [uncultured Gilliamella sp.]